MQQVFIVYISSVAGHRIIIMRNVGCGGCSRNVWSTTEIAPTGSIDQRHVIHFMYSACAFGHQLLDANTVIPNREDAFAPSTTSCIELQ